MSARVAPTGADWERTVIELAKVYGWMVAHFRPAKTEKGWRTPVSADGKGFPDLVLVKAGRLIFAELKGGKAKLSIEQEIWLEALGIVADTVERRNQAAESIAGMPGARIVSAVVWRPGDFDQVSADLRASL